MHIPLTTFLGINSKFVRWYNGRYANNTQCLMYISPVPRRHDEGQAHSVVTGLFRNCTFTNERNFCGIYAHMFFKGYKT